MNRAKLESENPSISRETLQTIPGSIAPALQNGLSRPLLESNNSFSSSSSGRSRSENNWVADFSSFPESGSYPLSSLENYN